MLRWCGHRAFAKFIKRFFCSSSRRISLDIPNDCKHETAPSKDFSKILKVQATSRYNTFLLVFNRAYIILVQWIVQKLRESPLCLRTSIGLFFSEFTKRSRFYIFYFCFGEASLVQTLGNGSEKEGQVFWKTTSRKKCTIAG